MKTFDRTVAPILAGRCLECHNAADHKGGLDLSTRRTAIAGGDSGAAFVAGKPHVSYLWQRVRDGEMPPKHPLPDDERKRLKQWIADGAVWGTDPIDPFKYTSNIRAGYDWWSLQPVRRPVPPEAADAGWAKNPIDTFTQAKLKAEGLTPSSEADRRTLIRRLSFDLLGLPPSPEDVDRFVADPAPDAYERVINRVLASPRYGERWARHWLDVARFGESQGFERDKLRTHSWRYRDWVVDALNADMPYDEFSRLQIAGDVLRPDDAAAVTATGFLVAGPYDEVGQSQQSAAMKVVVRQDELEDLVSVVGQTFLGLTVNCARCHDHKFDPVRQEEYYRLTSALGGVRHGDRDLPGDEVRREARERAEGLGARSEELTRRIEQMESAAALTPEQRRQRDALQFERHEVDRLRAETQATQVYAVTPKPPGVAHLLYRGNPGELRDVVSPGGVACVKGVDADFGLKPDAPDEARRRDLSAWIADPDNPLFARTIVNRLWHYHFGVGLVDTPSDLGFNGGRPSHPELLDWLAAELRGREKQTKPPSKNSYSLKHIHRLIVTSATYRQSSRHREAPAMIDADNRLLWRKSPMRLEAEAVRDAMLAAAGELNPRMGGPGYRDFTTFVQNTQFYEMLDPPGAAFNRRSLYRTWVRSGRSRFLDVFDCPDPSTKAPDRAVTTTPLQALALLNNSFVLRTSDRMAEHVRRDVGDDVDAQIVQLYRLLFGRRPEVDEIKMCRLHIKGRGLEALCRVLFNSNEMLYVD